MSLSDANIQLRQRQAISLPLARILVAAVATGIVAGSLAFLSWLLLANGILTTSAPRNPFGTGLGTYAPSTTGIGGFILVIQAHFYGALTTAVQAFKVDGTAITSFAGIGFLYGIFHAAGPGHGKGVISAYIVAKERSISRGLALSFTAAFLQAAVAIALVGVLAVMMKATASSINASAKVIELTSFAAIASIGAVLVWSKAGEFVGLGASLFNNKEATEIPNLNFDPAPGHSANRRMQEWREFVAVVLAAGIRPCSGAIILLVFALSQGLFGAGVVGALAMAFGTSLTTGTLASLAVFARTLARRVASKHGRTGALVVAGIEVLAAAGVLMLGLVLFTGMWTGGLPSALD
jgi:nickel/cobalt exporter